MPRRLIAVPLIALLLAGCAGEKLAAPYSAILPQCKDIEGVGRNQKDANFEPWTPEPGSTVDRQPSLGGGFRSCKGKGLTLRMSVGQAPSESVAEKEWASMLLDCNRDLEKDMLLHCRELPSSHLLTGMDEVAEFSYADYPVKSEEEDEGQDGDAGVEIVWRRGTFTGWVDFVDERPVVAREEGGLVDVYELDYSQISLAEEVFGQIQRSVSAGVTY